MNDENSMIRVAMESIAAFVPSRRNDLLIESISRLHMEECNYVRVILQYSNTYFLISDTFCANASSQQYSLITFIPDMISSIKFTRLSVSLVVRVLIEGIKSDQLYKNCIRNHLKILNRRPINPWNRMKKINVANPPMHATPR